MRLSSMLLIGVLLVQTGCATAQPGGKMKEIHWREQVRLSTGEVIVVERGEKLRRTGEGLKNWWLFDEGWLQAKLPGVGSTRWEGTLSPLVLDVTAKGEWYLLGVIAAPRAYREFNLPEHKWYVAFKLQEGVWQRVPFAEFPEAFKPNLLADSYELFIKREHPNGSLVEFDLKSRIDVDPRISPVYKRIDRSLGE